MMLLTRWEPITINGREFAVDEIYEGEYEICVSPANKKVIKNSLKKLTKEAHKWEDLPGENRFICKVDPNSRLFMLIEEAKFKKLENAPSLLSA